MRGGSLHLVSTVVLLCGCQAAGLMPRAPSLPGLFAAASNSKTPFQYTHLEVNSMLWRTNGLCIAVDPIAGQLDFGIPFVYKANQATITRDRCLAILRESKPDAVLLSQGLDDHCHLPTIEAIVEIFPDMRFICNPASAKRIASIVNKENITVLRPGQSTQIVAGSCSKATVRATEGALVGPPWQQRENGYILTTEQGPSVYYEPHGDVDPAELRRSGARADIVISPVVEQNLPAFTLVHGGGRTLDIARALDAKAIIPLRNGELRTEGPLASIIEARGTQEEFLSLAKQTARDITIYDTQPGKPIKVIVSKN